MTLLPLMFAVYTITSRFARHAYGIVFRLVTVVAAVLIALLLTAR